ncbi:hypothetical protein KNV32_gp35 [uncultured phage cr3_1]|jgi:hypothetical protein|uniref:Uncharacterized protein n=1 Tax=uncultured phage cr3_1 TaxID=2772065 RepID=A0A7M1RXL7_9CAUD|nr:hypothetical protein KNV32_gp35 [uncultured phage cr3_1]QOR58591.1 hypothetical protein [uncultured phage cr3_1]
MNYYCLLCGAFIRFNASHYCDKVFTYRPENHICSNCKRFIDNGNMAFREANVSSTGELHLGDKTIFISKEIASRVCNEQQLKDGVVFCTPKVFDKLFGKIEYIKDENSKTVS